MDVILLWFEGLSRNLLITALSAIIPLGLGVLFTFFASRNRIAETVFSWMSLPSECVCPVLTMLVLYYQVLADLGIDVSAIAAAVIAFTCCFSFYMPARFVRSDSFLKNVLVNGLGLLSSLFKWSFCVSFIGIVDMLKVASMMGNKAYNYWYYVIPFMVCLIIVGCLEAGKRLIKQFMK